MQHCVMIYFTASILSFEISYLKKNLQAMLGMTKLVKNVSRIGHQQGAALFSTAHIPGVGQKKSVPVGHLQPPFMCALSLTQVRSDASVLPVPSPLVLFNRSSPAPSAPDPQPLTFVDFRASVANNWGRTPLGEIPDLDISSTECNIQSYCLQ